MNILAECGQKGQGEKGKRIEPLRRDKKLEVHALTYIRGPRLSGSEIGWERGVLGVHSKTRRLRQNDLRGSAVSGVGRGRARVC